MREGHSVVFTPTLSGLRGDAIRHDVKRLAAGIGEHQRPAGAFEEIKVLEGLRDSAGRDRHAMVAHEEDGVIAESPGQPRTFLCVISNAAEADVHADDAEEARRVLVDRLHRGVLEARQCRRIGRMTVQQHAGLRLSPVDAPVNGPGRGVGRVRPLHHVGIIGVEPKKVARSDLREMLPTRIHEETLAVLRQRGAEVIADAFVPVELDSEPESRCQIDAQRPLSGLVQAVLRGRCTAGAVHVALYHMKRPPGLTGGRRKTCHAMCGDSASTTTTATAVTTAAMKAATAAMKAATAAVKAAAAPAAAAPAAATPAAATPAAARPAAAAPAAAAPVVPADAAAPAEAGAEGVSAIIIPGTAPAIVIPAVVLAPVHVLHVFDGQQLGGGVRRNDAIADGGLRHIGERQYGRHGQR